MLLHIIQTSYDPSARDMPLVQFDLPGESNIRSSEAVDAEGRGEGNRENGVGGAHDSCVVQ